MRRTSRSLAIFSACLVILAAQTVAAAPLDQYWKPAGAAFPPAGPFSTAAAWQAGQYSVTGNLVGGKRDSISSSLIVRKEEGGWVIETWSMDKSGKESVSQVLLGGMDEAMAGDVSKIRIVWMKSLKSDGTVEKTEGPAMAMIGAMMKSTYEKLAVNVQTYTDGGVVEVPAGSFAGTSLVKAKTKVMLFTVETESWFHPAVPVNGMVRSRSSDGKNVSELLSFGYDGTPRIP